LRAAAVAAIVIAVAGGALAATTVTVTSPNGGENWSAGTKHNITWTSNSPTEVRIELYKGGAFDSTIAASTPNDGVYSWTIPAAQALGTNYRVRISAGLAGDTSNADFEISFTPNHVTVVSPNGGESWRAGMPQSVTWDSNAGGDVKIELYKGGAFSRSITLGTANDGEFGWTMPADVEEGADYKVRVTSKSDPTLWDESDAAFTVTQPPHVNVISPAAGDTWKAATTHAITWDSNAGGDVVITLNDAGGVELTIAAGTPNDGAFDWEIPIALATGSYYVKVASTANGAIFDDSDAFTIAPPPYVTVTSPQAGDDWQTNAVHEITWSSDAGGDVSIALYKGGILQSMISDGTPNDGVFEWDVSRALAEGSDYAVEARSLVSSAISGRSGDFAISTAPYIEVASPAAGGSWRAGTALDIAWTSHDAGADVRIELYSGAALESMIAESALNNGAYEWTIPAVQAAGDDYRARVTSISNAAAYGDSSAFSITAEKHIAVTSPNGGEVWRMGVERAVTWESNAGGTVDIRLYKGTALEDTIAAGAADNGSYLWTPGAPLDAGSQYKIEVVWTGDLSVSDASDAYFSLAADDTAGPVVSNAASIPTKVREGVDLSLGLSATASDLTRGRADIAEAEYFIGPDPGIGKGHAMSAADGAFDFETEGLSATVDSSAWPRSTVRINVRAKDELGNWGLVTNVDVQVVDGVPPGAVLNLTAAGVDALERLACAGASASSAAPAADAAKAIDGSLATAWMSGGTPDAAEEWLVIDLGAVQDVGGVRLSAGSYRTLFPRTFRIDVSADGAEWKNVAAAEALTPVKGWRLWLFEKEEARFVRVEGTGVQSRRDRAYYVQIAEVEVYSNFGGGAAALTWTAPADDGYAGPAAAEYDLRYSASAITEALFESCLRMGALGAPRAPGNQERKTVGTAGVSGTVHFAVKTADGIPNWSAMSNVAATDVGTTGLVSLAPADKTQADPDAPPEFEVSIDRAAKSTAIAFSSSGAFPAKPTKRADGEIDRTIRFAVKATTVSWKPSASQWNAMRKLACTDAAVYWRLEGKLSDYGAVFGPRRSFFFDCGDIAGLAATPSHGAAPSDVIWPLGGVVPTFQWSYSGNRMKYFYIDVSTVPSVRIGDAKTTVTLGGAGFEGSLYQLTKSQWKGVRKLAAKSGGQLYWRVRAKDAKKVLESASAVKQLVIDGGEWTLSDVELGAAAPAVSWTHTGEGIVAYNVQFSADEGFPAGGATITLSAGSATSRTLTSAEVTRIKKLAARAGKATIYYRIRGTDADKAFVAYSTSRALAIP
jgi:hypothetical protein